MLLVATFSPAVKEEGEKGMQQQLCSGQAEGREKIEELKQDRSFKLF